MKVVIVESPAKAKTINKYLGSGYEVLASYGHVRDLPSKTGSVDPDKDFLMTWEMDPRGLKQVKAISDAVKKADTLYLATDPDREGEAISWHVKEVLAQKKVLNKVDVKRVVFYEVTKSAVQQAIKNPRDLDEGLIQAYLARRALDYLVGFTLSPVLWRKLPGSRSAGRVQSVALRLVTDREAEIENFIAQEYWSITGLFAGKPKKEVEARLIHYQGKKLDKFDLNNEKLAHAAKAEVEKQAYHVSKVEKKQVKRHPAPPFITSTLQQEASRKLRYSAKKTMQIAQKLYEGVDLGGETVGLITYMRTDSTNIAQEALQATRDFISNSYGKEYLPESPRVFKSKSKNAQEAHEAIRPTDSTNTPDKVRKALDPDQYKLYELIWKRMVASQMESALINQVSIDIASQDEKIIFRATGSSIAFDGFLKLYEEGRDEEDDNGPRMLPDFSEQEALDLKTVTADQHFTQPPPRYSEATLVKKLEELGIGRPSTYATILSTLLDRKYVHLEKRQLIPEALGRLVTSFLLSHFKKYVEFDFTANLEEQLDEIADGKLNWQKVLEQFWIAFKAAINDVGGVRVGDVIDELNKDLEKFLFATGTPGEISRTCPNCGNGTLSLKLGRFGAFLGCSNYPDCNYTRKLSGTAATAEDSSEGSETAVQASTEPKILGSDPKSNEAVSLRKGPYGFYLQWGEQKGKDKPKRVAIPRNVNLDSLDLEQALTLGALPKNLGNHPETGEEVIAGIGRFGPYIKHQGKFTSIPKTYDVLTIELDDAITILNTPKKKK
jgi:DNA topoisomerase-1